MTTATLAFGSEPCEALDPLQVFAAAGPAPRFYWEQPAAERFVVGVGCAERISVAGPERFTRAEAAAGEAFDRLAWSGSGPRVAHLVGGFAFAPSGPRNGLWRGFGSPYGRTPSST